MQLATQAPTLSGNAATGKVSLNWTSVPGATGYWVYRSEGHAGCNFGKTKIADVTSLSFNDSGLSNGRQYHYNIVAHGASTACFGAASNCSSVRSGADRGFNAVRSSSRTSSRYAGRCIGRR